MTEFAEQIEMGLISGYMAEFARYSLEAIKNVKRNDKIKKRNSERINEDRLLEEFLNKATEQFHFIHTWSAKMPAYDFMQPVPTQDFSVSLGLTFNLRRGTYGKHSLTVGEESIFGKLGEHTFILGNPGSGKTTIIKRAIRKHFFNSNNDTPLFHYPLLILCKDIKADKPIEELIAQMLGIRYSVIKGENEDQETPFYGQQNIDSYETVINDMKLKDFIIKVMNIGQFLIIFEGLDEYGTGNFEFLEQEIISFSRSLHNCKIIVTARPPTIKQKSETFLYADICALQELQKKEICSKYIIAVENFYNELRGKSYHDLSDRPLFLTYLILLYKNSPNNHLPESSSEIYEEIIDFFLRRWDSDRRIERKSVYAFTSPTKKRIFLSALAFEITYKIKSKNFTREELVICYEQIAPTFALPPNEAEQVAKEIESHTGLIFHAYSNKYEFSHLSLQEYLCAYHMVRGEDSESIINYFKEYVPPLALTIALSSNPTHRFSSILLKYLYTYTEPTEHFTSSLITLLNRLSLERPFFAESKELGVAILFACELSDCDSPNFYLTLDTFISTNPNIASSMRLALQDYRLSNRNGLILSTVRFKRKISVQQLIGDQTKTIERVKLPKSTYMLVMHLNDLNDPLPSR